MYKQIFRPIGPLSWESITPLLRALKGSSVAAIGLDIEAGNEDLIIHAQDATPADGYVLWDYQALLEAEFDAWIFWLTIHFFDSMPNLRPLIREDAMLFLDPTYRQNLDSMAEFYVWDASEVMLISGSELESMPGWVWVQSTKI
ncbi:MAG TPA: hypothetical protein PLH94_11700 [Fimbriimonadaceae bacterium]|nr:hypothetical protein [Fimbriimonadaceae bacterium]